MENRKVMVRNMEKYRLHTWWTFCLDERKEKDETAPSEGFRAVTLPHDWSTDYPFDPESDTVDLAVMRRLESAGIKEQLPFQRLILKTDRLFCILRAFT